MSKSQRLADLNDTLDIVLSGVYNLDAKLLLIQFVKGFKIISYRKEAKGIRRAWYTFIAVPLLIDGYIRDVRVNSTTGKKLFPEQYKFGTLTATVQRVVDAGPVYNYDLAVQIGKVLNDYDEGHIKFGV